MPPSPASKRKSARRLPSRLRKTGEAPTGEIKRLRDEAAAAAIAREQAHRQAETQRAEWRADSAPARTPNAHSPIVESGAKKSDAGGDSVLDCGTSATAPEEMVEVEVEVEDSETEPGAARSETRGDNKCDHADSTTAPEEMVEVEVELEDTKKEDLSDRIQQEQEAHTLVARAPPTPPPALRKRKADQEPAAVETAKRRKSKKLDRNRCDCFFLL